MKVIKKRRDINLTRAMMGCHGGPMKSKKGKGSYNRQRFKKEEFAI